MPTMPLTGTDDALQSLLQELLFFVELLFVGEVQICASAAFF